MNTKRSLFTSCISLLLCFVMFVSTTFAWFTDVVVSSDNKIQSGTLSLDLSVLDKQSGQWSSIKDSKSPIFNHDKWEPGYTDVKILKVSNLGSLSLKWVARFASENPLSDLAKVIDVLVYPGVAEAYPTDRELDSNWKNVGTLDKFVNTISETTYGFLDAGESATLGIALRMQENAGNEYQNLTLGEFDIRLFATQASVEDDSFGTDYDANAKYPDEIDFETSASLDQVQMVYGALANDFIIRYSDSIYALLPAGTEIESGVSSLKFSGKSVDGNSNISVAEGDSAKSYDIHIEGIAATNNTPITVYLGAILAKDISNTSLKLYHEGTPMTRVNSVADFATENQYVYDSATGELVIYVKNFSVFSAIETEADKWNGTSDTSWYVGHESDAEYILNSAAAFAGFRDLVDAGNTFEGKTVKLGVDVDLTRIPFDPIGFGYYNAETNTRVFMGTFDGQNHTIYNLYENCWELDPDKTNYSTYTYSTAGAGLFASIKDATIKNLAISGAEIVFECVDMGIVVGYAQGTCHFENIVVTDSNIANYNRYTGGVVGEVSYGPYGTDTTKGYSHTFKNITVDSTVKVSGLWGSFGCGMGGVIGGKWGDATVKMENVISAAEMDVYNDVVSAYQWYAFRGCGMLIGHTEEPYSDGRHSGNATASFLTCENVKVYYGDWVNYNYYEFENQDSSTGRSYPWVRAEAGEYCDAFSNIRYGVPTHGGIEVSKLTEEELKAIATDYTPIVFDQLYGADRGMYGTATHEGVAVFKKNVKTVYIHNNLDWTNLKLHYWYKNGDDTWTNIVDGVDLSDKLLENEVYKIEVPIYAEGFKITADGEKETHDFLVAEVANNGFYLLEGEHEHSFDASGDCICGCKKVAVSIPDYANANGWNNATQYTNIVMNSDITITASSGGNNGKYYTSGNNWRIYQTDSGTFTINSKNGNIRSIKVEYIIDNTGILTLDNVRIESGTVVNVNDTSVTFGVGNTGSVGNGHIRISNIEVVYSTLLACYHTNTVTETKDPTCTAAGYTAEKCVECEKILSMDAGDPALGHSFSGEVTKEPTCTETGLTTYTCGRCQASYTEKISETGHQNTTTITVNATCTATGVKTFTCTVCGDTKTEEIPMIQHNYVDGTCSVCGGKMSTVEIWQLVTDASTLNPGDKIVIVAKDYDYALSTTQNGNNRGRASVTKNDDTITFGDDVQIITLEAGTVSDTFAFNVDNGYLYAASSGSNYLRTEGTLSNNSSWKITIADGTATIVAQGSNTRNTMQYNQSSSLFSCYASASQKALSIYKLEGGSSEPDAPACEHTNKTTTTVDATCTEAGVTTVTCVDCGETISEETVDALGHTTENGTCERCGEEIGGTTEPSEPKVVLEITKDDFNATSYAANNNTKTEGDYSYTSYQVMNQSSVMQWQKSKGYITIASNEFVKLEIKVTAGTYTVTVGGNTVTGTTSNGVTTYDLTGLTGEVKISVGSATGKVDYLKFYK